MGDTPAGDSPKRLLDARGLKPRKRLGQHFLVEPRFAGRIADELPHSAGVIEIGGGTGTLTAALAQRAERVVTLEVDAGLVGLLRERFENIAVLHVDALQVDFSALLDELPEPRAICGNLPYNITTPLIERILTVLPRCESAVLMVQREYARRLTASAGARDYSSLSVFAAYHATCSALFEVGPAGFYPQPRVASTVVRLVAREPALEGAVQARFLRFVRASFAQRRKTLANSASSVYPSAVRRTARSLYEAALSKLSIDPAVRAEALDLRQMLAIFRESDAHVPAREP